MAVKRSYLFPPFPRIGPSVPKICVDHMTSRALVCIAAVTLFAALAIRVRRVAQEEPSASQDSRINLDILGKPDGSTQESDGLVSENAPILAMMADSSATATASAPAVSLSPTSLTFPAQVVGTTSAAKTVRLKNVGNASLTIAVIRIIGANLGNFSQTHNCLSTLAAGASCTISVKFTPTATGTRTAVVSIRDNAAAAHKV